jgi:hypothetical protein
VRGTFSCGVIFVYALFRIEPYDGATIGGCLGWFGSLTSKDGFHRLAQVEPGWCALPEGDIVESALIAQDAILIQDVWMRCGDGGV